MARAVLLGVGLLVLLGVLIGCAWAADDAFIAFRTVRNVWNGDGLTWNPGERVQTYTSPAWLLVSALCFGVARECYFSVLAVSLVLTLSSAWLLVREREPLVALTVLLILSASRAFSEYAVSGLENPGLCLLLVLFACSAQRASLLALTLLAAAICLTRIDAGLLIGPSLLLQAVRTRQRRVLCLVAGFAPLLLWELFSLVYYGALVPNTALAKLNLAWPRRELYGHGLLYFANSLRWDPLTLLTTVGCTGLLVRQRQRLQLTAAAGVALAAVYLVAIGGDFMSGRMLGPLFVYALASALSVPLPVARPLQRGFLLCVTLYGVLWPGSPWHIDLAHGQGRKVAALIDTDGIADERAIYYPTTGLVPVLRGYRGFVAAQLPIPPHERAIRGRAAARSDVPLAVADAVGFFGYFAGRTPIIDLYAITDPVLARVPAQPYGPFRAGHYRRPIPDDYLDSRRRGVNVIRDPELAQLYEQVQLVTRAPLGSPARWRAIWWLHTGR